jgi:hypothetical protein
VVRPLCFPHQAVLLHIFCACPADRNGKQYLTQYDLKNHKIFLKKIQYPEIKLEDLFIGNVVLCFNRQLKIVGYGDEFTRKELVGEDTSNRYLHID